MSLGEKPFRSIHIRHEVNGVKFIDNRIAEDYRESLIQAKARAHELADEPNIWIYNHRITTTDKEMLIPIKVLINFAKKLRKLGDEMGKSAGVEE